MQQMPGKPIPGTLEAGLQLVTVCIAVDGHQTLRQHSSVLRRHALYQTACHSVIRAEGVEDPDRNPIALFTGGAMLSQPLQPHA